MFIKIFAVLSAILLSLYIANVAHIPILVWFADGGILLAVWSALAILLFVGIWVILGSTFKALGWVWLGLFGLWHLGLLLPAIQNPWLQDNCLDRGGSWQPPNCIF
jgi:hypothetical protein